MTRDLGLDQFLRRVPPVTFAPRQTLYSGLPNAIYLVIGGVARIFRDSSDYGRYRHLFYAGTGDVFGENLLVDVRPTTAETAVSVTELVVMRYLRADLAPSFLPQIPRIFAARAEERAIALDRMSHLTFGRVLLTLREILDQVGTPMAGTKYDGLRSLPKGITHDAIAAAVFTSREIVTASLGRLRRQNILIQRPTSRESMVVDIAALDRLIGAQSVHQARRVALRKGVAA